MHAVRTQISIRRKMYLSNYPFHELIWIEEKVDLRVESNTRLSLTPRTTAVDADNSL
jgi:hypothetical protein